MSSTKLVAEYAKFKKATIIRLYEDDDAGSDEFRIAISIIEKAEAFHRRGMITTDDAMKAIANA